MRFEPQPNDLLQIGSEVFLVAPNPAVPRMAYGQEGRKSIVYQLKRKLDGRPYALKVFKPLYRGSYILDVNQRLGKYAGLPGMEACNRIVLTRHEHDSLIRQYPELEYAVLMPWVADQSWQNVILGDKLSYDRRSRPIRIAHTLSAGETLKLAEGLVRILASLESKKLAHCDIAGSNVMVDIAQRLVYLVDVEDIYDPGQSPPSEPPAGTAGYQHRTSRTSRHGQWCAEGDRFSGAVLLAEIMAWHDPGIRKAAEGEHYFAEGEVQDETCDRYKLMLRALIKVSTDVAKLFRRAWLSSTLANCPQLDEWFRVVTEAQEALPQIEKAIASDKDGQILQVWQQYQAALRFRPEAQKHRLRVELARKRCDALEQLRGILAAGLGRGNDERIWQIYSQYYDLLEKCPDFTNEERELVEQARRAVARRKAGPLRSALWIDDDIEIEKVYSHSPYQTPPLFQGTDALSSQEQARAELAMKRVAALRELQSAILSRDPRIIARVYTDHVDLLRHCSGFTAVERQKIVSARRTLLLADLQNAIQNGIAETIVKKSRGAVEAGCALDHSTLEAVLQARRDLIVQGQVV